jgi:spore coat protein CotF
MQGQEQLCIQKYDNYAKEACSEQLRSLFQSLADVERGHLNSINELSAGRIPSLSSNGSTVPTPGKASYTDESAKKKDSYLCSDMLATEKHVSSVYDTGVFEFSDAAARGVLNHIQSEEQSHGLYLYDYMNANGMYGN